MNRIVFPCSTGSGREPREAKPMRATGRGVLSSCANRYRKWKEQVNNTFGVARPELTGSSVNLTMAPQRGKSKRLN